MAAKRANPSLAKEPGNYHHGDLRRALIEAALTLIRDGGVKQLSLREAARRAGVSTAAPYRHFASRDALLAAVAEAGFRVLCDAIRDGIGRVSDPLERLREAGIAYVLFATAHAEQYSVMFDPLFADKSDYPELRRAAHEAFGLLLGAIRGCRAAGVITDEDEPGLALAAWAHVHGLAALINSGQVPILGIADAESRIRQGADHILFGLTGSRHDR